MEEGWITQKEYRSSLAIKRLFSERVVAVAEASAMLSESIK
jgi:hypothetical protein